MVDPEKMKTGAKARKINLNNKEDLDMLITELRLIDPSGTLPEILKGLLIIEFSTNALNGKLHAPAAPIYIPKDFIDTIRRWRDSMQTIVEKADNLIIMMEEGV